MMFFNRYNLFSWTKKSITVFLIVYFLFGGFNSLGSIVFDLVSRVFASTNSAQKQYTLDIGPITGSTTANFVYTSFFNPSGSGSSISIKRIAIRAETASSTASNFVNLTMRRITTASVGTQVTATNFVQKNASSSSSIADVRTSNPTVTFSGTTDSRILGLPLSGSVGAYFGYRDLQFETTDEKYVLQPGEGIALYQEAAGTAATAVRVIIEWDETTNAPSAGSEYLFAFPRVAIAATTNYVYSSFFNPVGSGKSAVIRRIWLGAETCGAAAVYTNNIVLVRTSAASAGTQILASNVPKKNTSSSDSIMEFRHTNVTVTTVGSTDSRLGNVTPCGAAAQAGGWQRIDFNKNDERLVLKAGEGIALQSLAAGNVNQFVRMIVEWQEVPTASTPSSQGEYIWSSNNIATTTAANVTYVSFFNPAGSGKTAVVKRLVIRSNASAAANYNNFAWRRITAASAGNLIATSTLTVMKNTSTASSSMELRWCGATCSAAITATYSGTTDSNLISINGPGAVGQTIGQREIVFGSNEMLVLQPGEGIGLYAITAGSVNQKMKVMVEWGEQASTPTAQGEYLIDIGPVAGNTAATYNYMTFFNPLASGKTAVIKRLGLRVDAVAAASFIPIQVRRITAASAGTQITAANIPKKHTGSANSVVEIRRTGVTATLAGTTNSKIIYVQTPNAVASASAGNTGYKDVFFDTEEPIVLAQGEGIGVYQDVAGNANHRVRLLVEWAEQASAPSSLSEYFATIGSVNQNTALGYVYATLFNPATSGKNFIFRTLSVQVDRNGTVVAPAYGPVSIRKITAASAGTSVASTSIQRNNQTTATTSADIRTTGVTVTLAQATTSRILGVTVPGVINQPFGDYESQFYAGDELVLKPGEGVALYNEQTQGDALVRYSLLAAWKEESTSSTTQSLMFTVSTTSAYFGTVSYVQARYASSTNTSGSASEVEAHSLSAKTNATNGYSITIKGGTLTAGTTTIQGLGSTSSTSNPGTEQFGLRMVAAGGSGAVNTVYAGSGFAFGVSTSTVTQIASSTIGDSATTTFSVRYLVNIAPTTPSSNYSTNLVYIVTANF